LVRRAVLLVGLVAFLAAAAPGAVADPRELVVRVSLAGEVEDGPQAGYYYVAFSTLPGLLVGPTPDGQNWTHYVLFWRGRFFFAGRRTVDLPPQLFRTTLPPEPYNRGAVAPDRRGLVVEVPLRLLQSGQAFQVVKVNAVTADRYNRPVDALGKGVSDTLGFVSFDLGRDVVVTGQAVRGNAPPAYDLTEVQVTLRTP
jgi:hypothetical protein